MAGPVFALPAPYSGPVLPYHPDPPAPRRARWVKRWLKFSRNFADEIAFRSAHGPMRGLRSDLTIAAKYLRTGQWHGALDRAFAALREAGASDIDLVVNIGANNGCTALPLLKHGFAKRVIAIEPDPVNVALCARNVADNGLSANVTMAALALGAIDGEMTLETSPTNKGDHRIAPEGAAAPPGWRTTRVPVRRLDDAAASLPDLAAASVLTWMDVQGAEPLVVAGGAAFFARFPYAFAEFNPRAMRRLGATRDGVATAYGAIWNRLSVAAPDGSWRQRPLHELGALWDELGEDGAETDLLMWRAP